jgi:2-oxo-4-hydroxy-4-carboxy--5-ureidoimidazoline (OHCU) decarboxylase
MIPTIEQLNNADETTFLKAVEVLFEPAPPLAKALLPKRPFGSWTTLLDATESIMDQLSEEERIIVINAHPRIGEHSVIWC